MQNLVRLQTESPSRMGKAILQCAPSIRGQIGTVHGLQNEVVEVEAFVLMRFSAWLRINQLQLVTLLQHELRAGLGTDTDPIDPGWGYSRSIRLDGDFEFALAQRLNEGFIHLQNRSTAGADNKPAN